MKKFEIKNYLTKLRQLYLRYKYYPTTYVQICWDVIKYISTWIANFYFVFISPTSKPRIFRGFGHWWLAVKYANKRYELTKVNKLCGGKRHYVLPYGKDALVVLDRVELILGKDKGIFNKNMNISEVLKHAYYITK
jgi:hypothetical protein